VREAVARYIGLQLRAWQQDAAAVAGVGGGGGSGGGGEATAEADAIEDGDVSPYEVCLRSRRQPAAAASKVSTAAGEVPAESAEEVALCELAEAVERLGALPSAAAAASAAAVLRAQAARTAASALGALPSGAAHRRARLLLARAEVERLSAPLATGGGDNDAGTGAAEGEGTPVCALRQCAATAREALQLLGGASSSPVCAAADADADAVASARVGLPLAASTLNVKQLREELAGLRLPTSGKRSELVARLEAAAASAEAAGQEGLAGPAAGASAEVGGGGEAAGRLEGCELRARAQLLLAECVLGLHAATSPVAAETEGGGAEAAKDDAAFTAATHAAATHATAAMCEWRAVASAAATAAAAAAAAADSQATPAAAAAAAAAATLRTALPQPAASTAALLRCSRLLWQSLSARTAREAAALAAGIAAALGLRGAAAEAHGWLAQLLLGLGLRCAAAAAAEDATAAAAKDAAAPAAPAAPAGRSGAAAASALLARAEVKLHSEGHSEDDEQTREAEALLCQLVPSAATPASAASASSSSSAAVAAGSQAAPLPPLLLSRAHLLVARCRQELADPARARLQAQAALSRAHHAARGGGGAAGGGGGGGGGWLDGVLLAASTCEAMVDLSRLWALQGSLADAHAHARAARGLARRSGRQRLV